MAKVKGSVFGPRMEFIKKHATPEQMQQLMDGLNPELRDDLNRIIVSQWYPFEHYLELNRAIVKVLGKGDINYLHEVGRFSADVALNGIYKLFFRFGATSVIIKSAVSAWNQYFQNGQLTVELFNEKQACIKFENIEVLAKEHFTSVQGWVQRVLELSGEKNVQVKIDKFDKKLTTMLASWS